ncbi:MAG: SEC-C metal-binding domain-containing protein [Acetobacter sp.]|nr:SEC-C metal-binding domain-containing protein [Bacteroides sp.]MCM1341624.1 SEC-C metal-binding domain-containing protein [Acetobacter sp.]MCM1434055.1 SEC-C metal-binding domain-containing protein [Clostridiales bacterium]
MQSLECPHIKGELYWGEPAIECIDKIDVIQAVCIVSHPEDKRCILEIADDTRSEKEKFIMLAQYLELKQPYLQKIIIKEFKEKRIRKDIEIVGRKQPCPCGSGKKFRHCCGKNMYYEHTGYVVTPCSIVELQML